VASRDLKIEAAFAMLPLPGESESGDLSLIKRVGKGTLIAVVDGLGHGQEAASAAHAAVGALDRYSREPLIDLVRRCHAALVGLRGVVLGLAYLDPQAATMVWLGVGNVGGGSCGAVFVYAIVSPISSPSTLAMATMSPGTASWTCAVVLPCASSRWPTRSVPPVRRFTTL